MNITFEQFEKKQITVDIQDGYYTTELVGSNVYKVQGDNVLFVSYYENANDGLFLNSKVEIMQAYLFASAHFSNCIPTTEKHFKLVYNKVIEQVSDLTL